MPALNSWVLDLRQQRSLRRPVILTVANGGAGLVLIGQDGSADAEIPVASRFLFVRSNEAALAKAVHGLDEAAALVHH